VGHGQSRYVPTGSAGSRLLRMITVYLDACCLNRPFDDQTQDRIRLESEAVLLIIGHVHRGDWRWTGSEVLSFEVKRNPDAERAGEWRYSWRVQPNRCHSTNVWSSAA
jgi:hypothetical protein